MGRVPTALDVMVQAQVLDLLSGLVKDLGMGMMLISHDLGVLGTTCDRIAVMYAGQIIESGPALEIFDNPKHPYTRALLAALPRAATPRGALANLPGRVPNLVDAPPGCRFAPRCPRALAACGQGLPDAHALSACINLPEAEVVS